MHCKFGSTLLLHISIPNNKATRRVSTSIRLNYFDSIDELIVELLNLKFHITIKT